MSDVPKLSRLDLNLLLALDALITERSVSRAAERLGLSQPALSASLRRIRIQFSDPILVRRGNSFDLTPLASRLAPHAAIALEGARRVFAIQAEWSPQHSTREFTFYGSDYALSTIGPMVARAAAAEAPDVRLRFQLHSPDIVDDARSRLRSADGIVLPHGFLNALPYQDLWHDTWTIVASADNGAVRQGLTVERSVDGFLGLHVPVHDRRSPSSLANSRIWGSSRRSIWSSRASWQWQISSSAPRDSPWFRVGSRSGSSDWEASSPWRHRSIPHRC